MNWITIGVADDVPRRGSRCVSSPVGRLAIFRTHDDQYFATADQCPHRRGPLSQGIVHGSSVTCPLHNWVIDLQTGQAQGADQGSVPTAPVRVDPQGKLQIDISTLITAEAA